VRARYVQVLAILISETQRGLPAPAIDAKGENGLGRPLAIDGIVGGVTRRHALLVRAALWLHAVGLIHGFFWLGRLPSSAHGLCSVPGSVGLFLSAKNMLSLAKLTTVSGYLPGDRGAWIKSKCLNRAEFVVVGWSDPEGARPLLGALLLGYYEPDGRLIYAGRVGTGIPVKTFIMLHERLRPLAIKTMPLAKAPPRKQRFGGPLALSKVHWVSSAALPISRDSHARRQEQTALLHLCRLPSVFSLQQCLAPLRN
jgi:hypothetical protein